MLNHEKKIFIVLTIVICAMLFSGCTSQRNEVPKLSLSQEGVENTFEETTTWENVLTESLN